jgi:hypothetical protein
MTTIKALPHEAVVRKNKQIYEKVLGTLSGRN